MTLTKKQRKMLDFLANFVQSEGYSPSLEEIASGMGLSSLATVHKHLKNLETKGLLRRQWNHSRSLELTEQAQALLASNRAEDLRDEPSSSSPTPAEVVDLPLLGRIAAGAPIEAVVDSESLSVPASMLGRGEHYLLQVAGNSMIEEHIQDGDFVVIESRKTAHQGETVVALIGGEEVTLKKFYRQGNTVRLQPANETMQPIEVPADRVQVQGVVVGLLRRY